MFIYVHRNMFQNGINTFSKMVKTIFFFGQKAPNFVYFVPAYGPNTYQIM